MRIEVVTTTFADVWKVTNGGLVNLGSNRIPELYMTSLNSIATGFVMTIARGRGGRCRVRVVRRTSEPSR